MNRTYKFRLYPSQEQENLLVQWLGCVRFIWNKMLSDNINRYQVDNTFIWGKKWSTAIPKLKKENDWLKSPPSQALQQKCDDLDKALRACVKKKAKQAGFPKFKSKGNAVQSLRVPVQNDNFKIHSSSLISIPKMKNIKAVVHRHIPGEMKMLTIKREGDKWFAVVVVSLVDAVKTPVDKTTSIGIDLGLTDFAILSNGTKIETPKYYRNKEKSIARIQRRLSRQKKGSKRYNKTKQRLRRLHQKISNQRHNFIHQESSAIAKQYTGVFVEDLNVAAIKERFGKSVSDQGWSLFVQALAYKANRFQKIDRFAPSSKFCHVCQVKHTNLLLSDRILPCCSIDRDINAAINILNWGYEKYTSGTEGSARGFVDSSNVAIDATEQAKLKREKLFGLTKEAE